ncbi:MAG: hypothetical protein K9K38_17375, partial [Rhodoferax sp.]|nr:hypothetical protein [Rhodoferax sp.]
KTYGLSYQHHLPPNGGQRSYLSFRLDEKVFNAPVINGGTAGQLDRSSRPVSLGYTVRVEADGAQWSYNTELVANLSGGYGNDLTAYQSEDPRIDSARWLAVRGAASYLGGLGGGWMWSARGQFQLSNSALISGEQFGLGGSSSVRGVADRAISGDSGVFTSLELTSPEWLPGLRAIGFVDMGWLGSRNTDLNPNKAASDRLGSAGLGLRYGAGALGMSLEWGQVFAGAMLPPTATAETPQAGDRKLHINLSARF